MFYHYGCRSTQHRFDNFGQSEGSRVDNKYTLFGKTYFSITINKHGNFELQIYAQTADKTEDKI